MFTAPPGAIRSGAPEPLGQSLYPLVEGDPRTPPESVLRRSRIEPVSGGKLFNEETRHERLATRDRARQLPGRSSDPGRPPRDRSKGGVDSCCANYGADNVANGSGLAIADHEWSPPDPRVIRAIHRAHDGRCRVINVRGVDQRTTPVDEEQPTCLRALNDAPDQLSVMRTPHKVRPDRHNRDRHGRIEHHLLGHCLRARVVATSAIGVGGIGQRADQRLSDMRDRW